VEWQANLGFAAFLLGGAAGGLLFGVLGDRYGRVRVMAATILVYSVFSALTAFAQAAWQVHVLRFLVALGTGGEWAIAAALVAETFPVHARTTASGLFHTSSVVGVGLASVTGMIFVRPDVWRWGFRLGVAPGLLVLWIRVSLREPRRWVATRPADSSSASASASARPRYADLAELLGRPPWRSRALLGLGLATVGLATYWGI